MRYGTTMKNAPGGRVNEEFSYAHTEPQLPI